MFSIYRKIFFFYSEKGLNGQMESSSDAQHLKKTSSPSKISHSPNTRGIFYPQKQPLKAI